MKPFPPCEREEGQQALLSCNRGDVELLLALLFLAMVCVQHEGFGSGG